MFFFAFGEDRCFARQDVAARVVRVLCNVVLWPSMSIGRAPCGESALPLDRRVSMRRIHALELEDQNWMPRVLREGGMAYLRFAAEVAGMAEAIRPVIEDALDRSGEDEIFDLCSGGGGPVLGVARALNEAGREMRVTLSDRFPDPGAVQLVADSAVVGLRYELESIDALDVPPDRPGLRTLFNAFHHLRPEQARAVLASAVEGKRPIAVVEMLQRKPLLAISMLLFAPLVVTLVVPFLRPFRWSWLPLSYLVPAVQLLVVWDGVVSVFRIYTRDELLEMAREVDPEETFEWTVEEFPIPPQPIPGLALVGVPRRDLNEKGPGPSI